MKRIHSLVFACIAIAILGLSTGYAIEGYWSIAGAILLLGAVWIALRFYQDGREAPVALLAVVGLAVAGLLLDLHAGLMILPVVAALAAWDLEYFEGRVRNVEQASVAQAMENQHLNRLGVVSGLGLFVSAFPFLIKAQFAVGLAILIGIVAILGLSRLIEIFTLESD